MDEAAAGVAARERPPRLAAAGTRGCRRASGRTWKCRARGSRRDCPASMVSCGSRATIDGAGRGRSADAALARTRGEHRGHLGQRPGARRSAAGPPPVPPARPAPPIYEVPAGALRAGANTITLRVQNLRGDGGFLSEPAAMYLQSGESRTPLSGAWKYRVERQTQCGGALRPAGRARRAPRTLDAEGDGGAGRGAPARRARQAVPDVVLRLNVIPDQLKWDRWS